jgi:hypothetical protein
MKNMSKALPRRQEQVRDYPVPPEREGDKTSGNRVTLPEPASNRPVPASTQEARRQRPKGR